MSMDHLVRRGIDPVRDGVGDISTDVELVRLRRWSREHNGEG